MVRGGGLTVAVLFIAAAWSCTGFGTASEPDVGNETGPGTDAAGVSDVGAGTDEGGADDGAVTDADVIDARPDAPVCSCPGLVSAYRFAVPNALGLDSVGTNHMVTVRGAPKQSPITPPGFSGYSLELDGVDDSVCIQSASAFASSAAHTVCWWSQPAAPTNSNTNQFSQRCSYDTWREPSGSHHDWRINNCSAGEPESLRVENIYAVGTWVQICQTYSPLSNTRAVFVNGSRRAVSSNSPKIEPTDEPWCIGSSNVDGWWSGRIYLPMWFDRVLSDLEIQQVHAIGCCQ